MGQAISCLGSDGRTLLTAANDGDCEGVRQVLIEHVELAASAAFPKQCNCLHYAAAQGHIRILQTVLTMLDSHQQQPTKGRCRLRKRVLNQRSSKGQTPLMVACKSGHAFCARYLIEQGADIFARDKTYRLALHHAAANGREHVLKVLLDDSMRVATHDGHVALRNARRHGNSCNCRYINSRAENGLTALHLAAFSGSLSCMQLLLAAGADVMMETIDQGMSSIINMPAGSTVLHAAVESHQVSIVQAVLLANANAMRARDNAESEGQVYRRIDLRLLYNAERKAPYMLTFETGFGDVINLLRPAVPMELALRMCTGLGQGLGPPSLKVMAGAALRQHLLNCCKAIKDALLQHDHLLKAGAQSAGFWFNGVLVNFDVAALGLGQALSKAGIESEGLFVEDSTECGICMDSIVQLAITPCEHELCTDCLAALCQQQGNPPSCPFCRQMICSIVKL